jgi:predicted nucleic acid-binding protein
VDLDHSDLVDLEIEKIADLELRERVRLFAPSPADVVPIEQSVRERGRQLEQLGFGAADALHLACAEAGDSDVFLTTDDRLFRRAARMSEFLRVPVLNPLRWIAGVLES